MSPYAASDKDKNHTQVMAHNSQVPPIHYYYNLQNCGHWAAKFGAHVIPMSVKYSPRYVSVSLLQIIPSFPSFNFSYPISFIPVIHHLHFNMHTPTFGQAQGYLECA